MIVAATALWRRGLVRPFWRLIFLPRSVGVEKSARRLFFCTLKIRHVPGFRPWNLCNCRGTEAPKWLGGCFCSHGVSCSSRLVSLQVKRACGSQVQFALVVTPPTVSGPIVMPGAKMLTFCRASKSGPRKIANPRDDVAGINLFGMMANGLLPH